MFDISGFTVLCTIACTAVSPPVHVSKVAKSDPAQMCLPQRSYSHNVYTVVIFQSMAVRLLLEGELTFSC